MSEFSRFLKEFRPLIGYRRVRYIGVGEHKGDCFLDFVNSGWPVFDSYLFEPNPNALEVLRKRTEAIHDKYKITVIPKALSNTQGTAKLKILDDMSYLMSDVENGENGELIVNTSTLDQELVCGEPVITFLKIDVEGHELNVLEGAKQLLNLGKIHIIHIEAGRSKLRNQQTPEQDIDPVLQEFGFDLFRRYEQMHDWILDRLSLRRNDLVYVHKKFVDETPFKLSQIAFESENVIKNKEALIQDLHKTIDEKAQEVSALTFERDENHLHVETLKDQIESLKRQLEVERKDAVSAREYQDSVNGNLVQNFTASLEERDLKISMIRSSYKKKNKDLKKSKKILKGAIDELEHKNCELLSTIEKISDHVDDNDRKVSALQRDKILLQNEVRGLVKLIDDQSNIICHLENKICVGEDKLYLSSLNMEKKSSSYMKESRQIVEENIALRKYNRALKVCNSADLILNKITQSKWNEKKITMRRLRVALHATEVRNSLKITSHSGSRSHTIFPFSRFWARERNGA